MYEMLMVFVFVGLITGVALTISGRQISEHEADAETAASAMTQRVITMTPAGVKRARIQPVPAPVRCQAGTLPIRRRTGMNGR